MLKEDLHMKKILLFFILLATFLMTSFSSQAASDIKLYIDGSEVECAVAPMIVNDRAMVPARVVFENLDADVKWDPSEYKVHIKSENTYIVFTIGKKDAVLNGKKVSLDAAPVIVSDRTMVPIRFVSENLGYDVDWNGNTRCVFVTTPEPPEEEYVSDILSVDTVDDDSDTRVVIKLTEGVEPKIMTLEDPFRLIIDFYDTSLSTKDGKMTLDNIYINEVRWAIHEDYARIVIETNGKQPFEITGEGTKRLTVRVGDDDSVVAVPDKDEINDNNDYEDDDRWQEDVEIPDFENMVIVIDAGHGGRDVGAIAKDEDGNDILDENGNPVLMEKDINLYIAQKIRDNLKANNVKVLMTRDDDTFIGTNMENLLARCDFANINEATLFLSVHNNSATSPKATGTEICYTEESSGKFGITSKDFAKNVLPLLTEATGLTNRGLVNRPNLVLLKYTSMPAILIECGFLTCKTDREVLMNRTKLDEIAKAVSEGIIKSMKEIAAKAK